MTAIFCRLKCRAEISFEEIDIIIYLIIYLIFYFKFTLNSLNLSLPITYMYLVMLKESKKFDVKINCIVAKSILCPHVMYCNFKCRFFFALFQFEIRSIKHSPIFIIFPRSMSEICSDSIILRRPNFSQNYTTSPC